MGWQGTYCACGTLLEPKRTQHYVIAGKEVCGKCWAKPRIAPSLVEWPYKKEVTPHGESIAST